MEIKLLGAIDYLKLKEYLVLNNYQNADELINKIKEEEKYERARKVSSAGRLSRFKGDVFDVLGLSETKTLEQNEKFIKRVISMGHNSITDHDYLVFAIKDVSPVVEQTIIEERFSSFTIKSRREVDFSNVGFYTPDFHDVNGNIIKENELVKKIYNDYMNSLFKSYSNFEQNGVSKEDARYILPYCYNSNILMGIDAHVLKDLVIKFTKTKYSKVQELNEFGNCLYDIVKQNIPYMVDEIEKIEYNDTDYVNDILKQNITKENYQIIDSPKLLNHTSDIDKNIVKNILIKPDCNFNKLKIIICLDYSIFVKKIICYLEK